MTRKRYSVRSSWRSMARDAPGVATATARLGRRIRELRALQELTQEQAAIRAKVDPKHWLELEAGRTNPTLATLVGVARALRVKLADLFLEVSSVRRTQMKT